MKCPRCGNQEDKVIDSRSAKDGAVIRRRRECLECTHRFTTYEEIEREDIRVIKRDGRYEPFDRKKLLTGILKACEKLAVSRETIEKMVDATIEEIEKHHQREIPTTLLGEFVMRALKEVDQVAYVRFASVYRHFRDVNEFVQEIQNLK